MNDHQYRSLTKIKDLLNLSRFLSKIANNMLNYPKTVKARLKMLAFQGEIKLSSLRCVILWFYRKRRPWKSVIKHGNELTSDQVSDMALSCTLNMTLTFILHEVACLRDKYVTGSFTIAAYVTCRGRFVLYGQVLVYISILIPHE